MGAKTWMLVYSDGDVASVLRESPSLDRARSDEVAKRLFPDDNLEAVGDGSLYDTCPPKEEAYLGCFPGVTFVAADECGIDRPSQLPGVFLNHDLGSHIYLHAMHSVVDWFAFAAWESGELKRSLSLSPDDGVMEDIGERFEFEEPYWSGAHPAVDDEEEDAYPFRFHPLELGEAALHSLFGYCLEGPVEWLTFEPENVPLVRFSRAKQKPWWKIW